jgi:hypothetical protein
MKRSRVRMLYLRPDFTFAESCEQCGIPLPVGPRQPICDECMTANGYVRCATCGNWSVQGTRRRRCLFCKLKEGT